MSQQPVSRFLKTDSSFFLVLLLLSVTWVSCASEGEMEGHEPHATTRTIGALGRLEPHSEIRDIGASAGRVDRLLVSERQTVGEGDELAYLDSYPELRSARDLAAARMLDAELRLKQVRELRPLEIEAQAARLRAAEAELENGRKVEERLRSLEQDGILDEDRLDRERLRVRRAEEQLRTERAILEQMKKASELDRELAEAQLATSTRELELAEARFERTVLRAPIDGRILKIHVFAGESVDGGPILQMGDTSIMHAVAEVYETEVGQVRGGQAATITSPALDAPLRGTVESVGAIIFKNDVLDVDPAAKADARVVEVRVRMSDSHLLEDLTNLQVDVLIEVGPPPVDESS